MPEPTNPPPANTTGPDPSPMVNGSLWSMTAAAMFFLVLRFWIKISRRCGLWWDDGFLALSFATLVANNGIISDLVNHGFGTEAETTTHMLTLIALSGFTTSLARVWSKTSFALTLLRVLDESDRFQRLFIWFVIASMHILSIAYSVLCWRRVCETQDFEDSEAVGRLPGPCISFDTILILYHVNLDFNNYITSRRFYLNFA
ncbi:hypothetical protein PG995_005796 [Apiospora arundinis]